MVQIIRSVTVHRVQTRDLPRLSCGVFVWNVGKNRSCAVFEQVENGGIESGSKGLAREGMKNGPSECVERKSQRGRERKQAEKGGNGLGFGLGKGLRSLRLIHSICCYSVDFAADVGTAALLVEIEADREVSVEIDAVIHVKTADNTKHTIAESTSIWNTRGVGSSASFHSDAWSFRTAGRLGRMYLDSERESPTPLNAIKPFPRAARALVAW